MVTLAATGLLLADGTIGSGVVEFDEGRVAAVRAGGAGHPDRLIVPGFVDLQVNGHAEIDVATADGPDWERMDRLLLAQGVTCWCPTLVTGPLPGYTAALARIAGAAARPAAGRSAPAVAGAHLEGPFLGGALGAHRPEFVADVDEEWLAALPEVVRLVTLAPEAAGALDAVRALSARGIAVSLGHSTATFEQAEAAIDAGARLVTHLFNAMAPFHHRHPGLVGAALTDDRVAVSVIADGRHVSPAALKLAFRAKPPGRVALVTDAVAWQPGAAGATRHRLEDGAARLPDGTLAGSVLTMDAAVRTAVGAGVALAAALTAASVTPAGVLGLSDRAGLVPGARADAVVLTPDLGVSEVWVAGQPAWP